MGASSLGLPEDCRARPTLKVHIHQWDYHQLPSGLWESLGLGALMNASSLHSVGGLQEEPMEPWGWAGTRVQAALSPLLLCSPPSLP